MELNMNFKCIPSFPRERFVSSARVLHLFSRSLLRKQSVAFAWYGYIFQRILEISIKYKSIFQSISHFQEICHHNCIQYSSPSSAVCLTQINLLSFANRINYRIFKIINNKIFRVYLQACNISEDINHHEYRCLNLKSVTVFYSLRLITSLNIFYIPLPSRKLFPPIIKNSQHSI